MEKKPNYSGNSINFRITAAAVAGLFFSFALIDAVVLGADLYPLFSQQFSSGADWGPEFWKAVAAEQSVLLRSPKYVILFAAEALILLLKAVISTRSVGKKLKPVEELSKMAMELSAHEDEFNEEKLKSLEAAIDKIRPADDDAFLDSGDRELEGLELAVNGLVRRMQDSYVQQARFVSDASHELRTPIAVIKGYADMLDRWGKTDEKILNESVDAIKSESERMSYLVEQLLFLARGDSGKTKLKIEEFDLFDLMHEVWEESKMIDPNHEYVLRSAGPIRMKGDEALLKQTARILTDNASKYTPKGESIVLRAENKDGEISFSVEDNGVGIARESLPYLFDRFYRADAARSGSTGGTGLGLAIAKWIVDRHGGFFRVVSREEIGTKISVVFPGQE